MSKPNIIFEDKDFIVVNKPSGLMVHGVRVSQERRESRIQHPESRIDTPPTLVDWLLERYPEIKTVGDEPTLRPGIVHRLDKDTSGVMLVARNQTSFDYLKSLFQDHKVIKTYAALVSGKPEKASDTIDAPIGILTGSTRRSVRSKKMAKDAVTEYRVIKNPESGIQNPEVSFLEVKPKTGRTHQIRVHLASIGHPILGDKLYGPNRKKNQKSGIQNPEFPRLMLHAQKIEFTALDGRRLRFEAELPEEFRTFLMSKR